MGLLDRLLKGSKAAQRIETMPHDSALLKAAAEAAEEARLARLARESALDNQLRSGKKVNQLPSLGSKAAIEAQPPRAAWEEIAHQFKSRPNVPDAAYDSAKHGSKIDVVIDPTTEVLFDRHVGKGVVVRRRDTPSAGSGP